MSTIKVKSNIIEIGKVLSDGTILTKEIAKQLVNNWNANSNIEYGTLANSNSVPGFPIIDFADITHKIISLELNGNFIRANIEVLDKNENVVNALKNNLLYTDTHIRKIGDSIIDIYSIDLTVEPKNENCIVKML